VTYPGGSTSNPGTVTGVADSNGQYTDTWSIAYTDPSGTAGVSITVTSGTQTAGATGSFKIYTPTLEACS
jgi:hypothetical protein